MHKEPKQKEGIARLMELAGAKKAGLTGACTLSVLSSVFKIIPFFTIYGILQILVKCYSSGTAFRFSDVKLLCSSLRQVLYCMAFAPMLRQCYLIMPRLTFFISCV